MEDLQTRKLFIIQSILTLGPILVILGPWIFGIRFPFTSMLGPTALLIVMACGILMGFVLAFRKSLTMNQRLLHAGLSMGVVVLSGVALVLLTYGMSRN